MNLKKIITTLSFVLLLSCGYEPIYSKKKNNNNYNFSINKINPFKNPHKIKFKLAPCHRPAMDIVIIKLKYIFLVPSLEPPKGI